VLHLLALDRMRGVATLVQRPGPGNET
jgi:hypothetical protein